MLAAGLLASAVACNPGERPAPVTAPAAPARELAPPTASPPAVDAGEASAAENADPDAAVVPLVTEHFGVGQDCYFSIFEGVPGDPIAHRPVRKRVTCDVKPRADAPTFWFEIMSGPGGYEIEYVQIGRPGDASGEKFRVDNMNSGDVKHLEAQDVNFDGYQDYRLRESHGTVGYDWYVYWVYAREMQRFVLVEGLRHVANPRVDPRLRLIRVDEPLRFPDGGVAVGCTYVVSKYRLKPTSAESGVRG